MDKTKSSFKDAYLSAIVLAMANMGDAFLYAYLPLNFQHIGLPAIWVGVILSVNRFTRLILNSPIAWMIDKNGIKSAIFITIVLATFTTISYGWINAIPLWILSRILWGVCFATLRFGNTLHALKHPQRGMALGLSRTIVEMGPFIALLAGPFLLLHAGRGITFLTFGLIGLSGIYFAKSLTEYKTENVSIRELHLSLPTSYNLMILIQAFIFEGILVVIVGKLMVTEIFTSTDDQLAMVGLLLGYKRVSLIVLSPFAGKLSDRYGFQKVFFYTILLSIASLTLITFGATVSGLLAAFTFTAMNSSTAIGGAITSKLSIIKETSDNATWRDMGSAFGTIAGAWLLPLADVRLPMAVLTVLLVIGLLFYSKAKQKNG